MSNQDFEARLAEDGNINAAISDACKELELGEILEQSVIAVGFEDYNVRVKTDRGEYVAKVFSKNRTEEEVRRNIEILEAVNNSDVHHPEILKLPSRDIHYVHASGLSMVVMHFVAGKTYFELQRSPTHAELDLIAMEALKISRLEIQPTELFDSWAIPNFVWMYEQTKDLMNEEGRGLATQALEHFKRLPLDALPKAFVHGDIIKSNTILGDDGKVYVIDFSVANVYPRAQELAVMAANLMADGEVDGAKTLRERVDEVVGAYLSAGAELTDEELMSVYDYALAGVAMEYMGGIYEGSKGQAETEVKYWQELGLAGLREALSK